MHFVSPFFWRSLNAKAETIFLLQWLLFLNLQLFIGFYQQVICNYSHSIQIIRLSFIAMMKCQDFFARVYMVDMPLLALKQHIYQNFQVLIAGMLLLAMKCFIYKFILHYDICLGLPRLTPDPQVLHTTVLKIFKLCHEKQG